MQFAGGKSVAQLMEEWERNTEWVEGAIRAALLGSIPTRDGGLKPSRFTERKRRSEKVHTERVAQRELSW